MTSIYYLFILSPPPPRAHFTQGLIAYRLAWIIMQLPARIAVMFGLGYQALFNNLIWN